MAIEIVDCSIQKGVFFHEKGWIFPLFSVGLPEGSGFNDSPFDHRTSKRTSIYGLIR